MARLFCGEVEQVIEWIRAIKPRNGEAEKVIARCAAYLEANRHRADYGSYERDGYPIGSGGVESAHRFICQARLKLPGAWWYVGDAYAMLAPRCAKNNGTFDRVFEKYAQREQGRPCPGPANGS